MNADTLARRFHELYEELAPSHGYETRTETRKPWADVPAQNKALMTAVCGHILRELAAAPSAPQPDNRDLALAIIKRCAAYVRGYMVPPPESSEYGHKTEWLRFQDCARLLEAQPNAILATTDVQPSSHSQGQERTALIERLRSCQGPIGWAIGVAHRWINTQHFAKRLDEVSETLQEAVAYLEALSSSAPADPIAAAVDAQLDPLKDELIAMGHKLAKGVK
jgi:hypothetical protein